MSTVNAGWRGPNIVKEGLVLYLDAASGTSYSPYNSGTTWRDISGNNNNGTLTNGPVYNTANGGSFVFDGVDDYVRTNNSLQPTTYSFFSTMCWVRSSNYSKSYMGIISDAAARHRFELRMLDITGRPQILFGESDTVNAATSSETLANNTWYSIAATFNNSLASDNIKLYVNGNVKATGNYTGIISLLSGRIDIGTIQNSSTYSWIGNIALAQIYNRTLTPEEVLQNYNSTKGRFGL